MNKSGHDDHVTSSISGPEVENGAKSDVLTSDPGNDKTRTCSA